jgi:ABC-type antimicrobial peptide transport system permease subunit
MWHTLRRSALYFLLGFVVSFLVYLLVRFDPAMVLTGVGISAGVGAVVAALILWLEHHFPEPGAEQ